MATRSPRNPALAIIARGETYGYLVAAGLAEAGLGTIKGGTLYPIINRLENDGSLSSSWRKGDEALGRKYYAITKAGCQKLQQQNHLWRKFTGYTNALLSKDGKENIHDNI